MTVGADVQCRIIVCLSKQSDHERRYIWMGFDQTCTARLPEAKCQRELDWIPPLRARGCVTHIYLYTDHLEARLLSHVLLEIDQTAQLLLCCRVQFALLRPPVVVLSGSVHSPLPTTLLPAMVSFKKDEIGKRKSIVLYTVPLIEIRDKL